LDLKRLEREKNIEINNEKLQETEYKISYFIKDRQDAACQRARASGEKSF